jgi:hypothetical protein
LIPFDGRATTRPAVPGVSTIRSRRPAGATISARMTRPS